MQALTRIIAKAPLCALTARTLAVRTISPRIFSGADPPLFGGLKNRSHIPTNIEQATGLERLQLLGQLHDVDVFNNPCHCQTRPYSGPYLCVWWLLRKPLELAGFLGIVFRLQTPPESLVAPSSQSTRTTPFGWK